MPIPEPVLGLESVVQAIGSSARKMLNLKRQGEREGLQVEVQQQALLQPSSDG